MSATLRIDSRDNLGVALRDLKAGEAVPANGDAEEISLVERIPAKQKFALRDFATGDTAVLYGVTVGRFTVPVPRGGLITTANLSHATDGFSLDPASEQGIDEAWQAPDVSAWSARSFAGYHREDGRVGTANHWIVVPLVFCENRNLHAMREALEAQLGYARTSHYARYVARLVDAERRGASKEELLALDLEESTESRHTRPFPGLDGVKFLSHGLGCGGSRDDARALCGLLAGYITHPNVAGATVLSLGCQNAQLELLQEAIAERCPNYARPLLTFEQQRWGTERAMLEAALRETFVGIREANAWKREPAPLSALTFGMECGGSDGFSGISANPTLGQLADRLVALGGSVILSEFPELCGVEAELLRRCARPEDAARFADLMGRYAARAEASGTGFDQNPSPGNIRDGLITDAIKSAGAAKKGGTSPIQAVLDYPEMVTKPGLTLLCTPGSDVESTTAMIGSGANLVFFSTGLGTPTGNPITPVVKVSTNTQLASRMPDIIDFDTGSVVSGERTPSDLAEDLLEQAIRVASGERETHAQRLGQDDFLPWKRGVSL